MSSYSEYKKNRKKIFKVPASIKNLELNPTAKIAVIVPFRDLTPNKLRTAQLETFLEYYTDYLPHIKIIIVEQSKDGKKFNRGKLLNIGFKIASEANVDAYIFHDVDLISPPSLQGLYSTIPEMPIHIANIWTEKYTFEDFLGGIISFNKKDYIKINGFPNDFWGWGGEDDAMYNRLVINEIPVLKPFSDNNEDKIKGLEHPSEGDSPKTKNTEKQRNILKDLKTWKKNGLNNLNYKLLKKIDNRYIVKI